MSFWSKLLGADKIVDKTMSGLDNLFTSDEERLQARNVLAKGMQEFELALESQLTERWKADMASDSWLSKAVRPMVLIATTLTMMAVYIGGMFVGIPPDLVANVTIVFGIVGGSYFGGREVGKGIVNWKLK